MHHGPESQEPADQLLFSFIAQHPNPAALIAAQPEVRKRRARALDHVRMLRNRCAHPQEPPPREELELMWAEVAEDRENGFYQYFGRAFLTEGETTERHSAN